MIVAGEAWIRNKGLTHDASTPQEYFRILDQLPFAERLAAGPLARARRYAYQEAIDLVLDGLAPLGPRYVDDLAEGFGSRWVDVHETKGKRSGAYSWGAYGAPPVILMNWNGTLYDVFTLAHEAGHAIESIRHGLGIDRTTMTVPTVELWLMPTALIACGVAVMPDSDAIERLVPAVDGDVVKALAELLTLATRLPASEGRPSSASR